MKDQWPLAFCLFCKNILEHTYLSKIALYICVARENLPLRHAVIFSMPCAWSGVKIFANLHLRNCFRSAIEASFIALTYSQLCVFAFYKCEPASVRQLKQVSLRSLTRSFVFYILQRGKCETALVRHITVLSLPNL